MAGNNNNEPQEITNPSYWEVVSPSLRKNDGDASELRRMYPNFDPDAVPDDTFGLSYLHFACLKNHFHAVRGLLQCGASLLQKDMYGCTALFRTYGIHEGRVDMVKWLLLEFSDARTTVNWADNRGWTPLHRAANEEATAIVRLLLAHGADHTLKNEGGETPAALARRYGRRETKVLKDLDDLTKQEWRPRSAQQFPPNYRAALRTIVVLAKATP